MKSSLISQIRETQQQIVVVGRHDAIIQSILDFDYLCGKKCPSISVMLSDTRGYKKYFWGTRETLVPVVPDARELRRHLTVSDGNMLWCLHVLSARRVLTSGQEIMHTLPEIIGGVIFAENVTEQHALTFAKSAAKSGQYWLGPSSVGLVVPGYLKLGAVGGVTPVQLQAQGLLKTGGKIAILSASGGMTGELISIVHQSGHGVSFALSYGGDRFPVVTPLQAYQLAMDDPQTEAIAYYGELGGEDEYLLIEHMKTEKKRKPFIAHIAGTVADLFAESPQFGHAKAKAHIASESAHAKREALKNAGSIVSESFDHFIHSIHSLNL